VSYLEGYIREFSARYTDEIRQLREDVNALTVAARSPDSQREQDPRAAMGAVEADRTPPSSEQPRYEHTVSAYIGRIEALMHCIHASPATVLSPHLLAILWSEVSDLLVDAYPEDLTPVGFGSVRGATNALRRAGWDVEQFDDWIIDVPLEPLTPEDPTPEDLTTRSLAGITITEQPIGPLADHQPEEDAEPNLWDHLT